MKIAFTSCTRFESFPKQPQWDLISKEDPDYFFLLGDNIYMDFGIWPFAKEPIGAPEDYSNENFEKLMERKYQNQFEKVPELKHLIDKMRAKNGFYAIWDDHDFAWNNAKGKKVSEKKKQISLDLFHKYLNCSTNLPHTYYKIDTPLARVLFLDNRTYADLEGTNSELLGETQFKFIEDNLNHDLNYTIICSGLSLTESSENWSKYPSELKRFCKLIENKNNVLFLGGDIHKNKFVKPHFDKKLGSNIPTQLISSGMQTSLIGLGKPFDNRHNWALLELNEGSANISFYSKHGLQRKKSEKANKFLNMKTNK